jgi:hypothetical protein
LAKKKEVEQPLKQKSKLHEYAFTLRLLSEKEDKLKEDLKKLHGEMEELNGKFLSLMELNNITSMKVNGVGTCYVAADIYPSVKDETALFAFLRKNEAASLIKETVHPATLKAYVKEQIENTNTIPDGVEVFPKNKVRIRVGK